MSLGTLLPLNISKYPCTGVSVCENGDPAFLGYDFNNFEHVFMSNRILDAILIRVNAYKVEDRLNVLGRRRWIQKSNDVYTLLATGTTYFDTRKYSKWFPKCSSFDKIN